MIIESSTTSTYSKDASACSKYIYLLRYICGRAKSAIVDNASRQMWIAVLPLWITFRRGFSGEDRSHPIGMTCRALAVFGHLKTPANLFAACACEYCVVWRLMPCTSCQWDANGPQWGNRVFNTVDNSRSSTF